MNISNTKRSLTKYIFSLILCLLSCMIISATQATAQSTESIIYTYDKVHRLIRVEYGDGTKVDYLYDNVDNHITEKTTLPGSPANNPPNIPSNPVPTDAENWVTLNPTLNWTGGDPDTGDVVIYDIYFGETFPPPMVSNTFQNSYVPAQLKGGLTTYYWKVVARDSMNASSQSPVWSFTTYYSATDYDGDGFTNTKETVAGSDNNNASSTPFDIDGDRWSDSEETAVGSDPNNASSTPADNDGDFIRDTIDLDNDNDGIPDTWENNNAFNPYDASDATMDIDGDTLINLVEYKNGTDPRVPEEVIVTVAGGDELLGDNGLATSAKLKGPWGVTIDAIGNMYIADRSNHRIRKVFRSGYIMTVAGDGTSGFSGDNGLATSAQLNNPGGVSVDATGNIYITDTNNHRIRKVDALTGVITTVAGDGTYGYSGDEGPAVDAWLRYPSGVAVDESGNIYIVDTNNHCIRKIDAITKFITTVAGDGTYGYSGDEGPAVDAQLRSPYGVTVDESGNIYVADTNNHRIRKVDAITKFITTVAGTGTQGYNVDNILAKNAHLKSPHGVSVDATGNIYIADSNNRRIRKVEISTGIITTVAGNGTSGYSGDNGFASSAQFNYPWGVSVDSKGNIYIADRNNDCIRKVDAKTGIISTVAGTVPGYSGDSVPATSAQLNDPYKVAVDAEDNLYIADTYNHCIRRVDALTGFITIVAGTGTGGYNGENILATSAQLKNPMGVSVDSSGNIYIADSNNYRIRKIDAITGIITTVAGVDSWGFSGDNGMATYAQLASPKDVSVDVSGNIYIVDGQRIRKIDALTKVITTVAGGSTGYSGDFAHGTLAQLKNPEGVAVDVSGNIYIADTGNRCVRKVDAITGVITTLLGSPTDTKLISPCGVSIDVSGSIYVADSSLRYIFKLYDVINRYYRVAVAGNGTFGYSGDGGPPRSAQINPTGVAVGKYGIYIADSGNNRIRKVNLDFDGDGYINSVETAEGKDPLDASSKPADNDGDFITDSNDLDDDNDGMPDTWEGTYGFNPLDASDAYIDTDGDAYKNIEEYWYGTDPTIASEVLVTIAGTGVSGYSGDGGLATSAKIGSCHSVSIDASGNVYIADRNNNRIRKLNASTGIITTVAGTATYGYSGDGGPATAAQLRVPKGVSVDSSGNIFIADTANSCIRKVDALTGIITTVAGNGTSGYSGDNGLATSAQLKNPEDVSVDISGNIFIADTGNSCIRKVDALTWLISTVAGNGARGYSGDNGLATSAKLFSPIDIAIDLSGNIFIADIGNSRIRKVDALTGIISTVAGNGTSGFSGDNGLATSAQLSLPYGVSVDPSGNIYIADYSNSRLRKVDGNGYISTISDQFLSPRDVSVDSSGNIYILDSARVLKLNPDFDGDGYTNVDETTASSNPLDITSTPTDIDRDFVPDVLDPDNDNDGYSDVDESAEGTDPLDPSSIPADYDGDLITDINDLDDDNDGMPDTWENTYGLDPMDANDASIHSNSDTILNIVEYVNGTNPIIDDLLDDIVTVAGIGRVTQRYNGDGIPAISAQLSAPMQVKVDSSGNIYIYDSDNRCFRKVDGITGIITTIAGTVGMNWYSGDNGPATLASLYNVTSFAVDSSDNIYIAGHYRIRKVDALTGIIMTVAGNGIKGSSADGTLATSAQFETIGYIAVDSSGNIYITETGRIRKIDAVTGILTTLTSGSGGTSSDASDNIYIAGGNTVIKINVATEDYVYVAGTGGAGYTGDGDLAVNASLNRASDVVADATGNLFIADSNNNCIRMVDASGIITTIAGRGSSIIGDGGPAVDAQLGFPWGVAVDAIGNLYISDSYQHRIRKVIRKINDLVAIEVTPSNTTIFNGDNLQFIATGTYQNGDAIDITSTVNWERSDISVITIDGNGLATGVGVGNVNITASLDSITSPAVAVSVLFNITTDFTADNTCGTVPFTVNFTNNSNASGSGFTYLWDFGDGNTSTAENPSHTYTVGGVFTVSLTVQDSNGSDTKTISSYIKTNSHYMMLDTNNPGGPVFDWIEISGTGTDLNLGDDSSAPVSLPFSFDFYGTSYNQIYVNSNGSLNLNSYFGLNNTCIPTENTPNIIAALWDDLNPAAGGNVYYEVRGTSPNRTLIVEWYNVPNYYIGGDATFEVILHEGSDEIIFQYLDVGFGNPSYDNGISATVGIQSNQSVCESKSYSCNEAKLTDQLAIQFISDIDNDGIPDQWEMTNFGDLATADGATDNDGDGLSDIDEYANNTDPKDTDTDNDGMPDGWEVAYELDPLDDGSTDINNGPNGNPDGDSLTNIQEYLYGSDPTTAFTKGRPICEIELNGSSFMDGDLVSAVVYRIANIGTAAVPVEFAIWMEAPGLFPIRILKIGSMEAGTTQSMNLPPGFELNAPTDLFIVDPTFPRGDYVLGLKMVDPVTQRVLTFDLNHFTINP